MEIDEFYFGRLCRMRRKLKDRVLEEFLIFIG